uniref:CSON002307 protein n=1 Tax=Culicoides sonorensis TaxID=179676 RepID=A0A336MIR4_CULSO
MTQIFTELCKTLLIFSLLICVVKSESYCHFEPIADPLLECLKIGQEKYTVEKCEPRTSYENQTKLVFHCLERGKLEGNFQFQCIDGSWFPDKFPRCQKTCPELLYNPIKTKVDCGFDISCVGPQITGTSVNISCNSDYIQPKSIDYTQINCLNDGSWSQPIYDCFKALIDVKNVLPLSTGGDETQINQVPYHAALYRRTEKDGQTRVFLKCSCTIISNRVIVTAAHCFHKKTTRLDMSTFFVVAGKFHRKYEILDPNTQESELSEIYIHDSYKNQDLFRDDLALVILETAFKFSPVVQKVEVDLNFDKFSGGTVSGWGIDENNNLLETLHTVHLNVVSCGEQEDLSEKFCAGGNGRTVCQGDSGGGYIVERNGINYLVGVVSTSLNKHEKSCNPNESARFNRISPYLNLFQKAKKYLLLFQTCEDYKFKCQSGKCINIEQICDGTIDCDQDDLSEDEKQNSCKLYPQQRMLQIGAQLLIDSKFYENLYPNWITSPSAIWITANFLFHSIRNETIRQRISQDFGVVNQTDDVFSNIFKTSIYESEFFYTTRNSINVLDDLLPLKYLKNIKMKRRNQDFFHPDGIKVGAFLNADYSQIIEEQSVNMSFVNSDGHSIETPMLCFTHHTAEVTSITELDADAISIHFTTPFNMKLYVLMPKRNFNVTLRALKSFNMRIIEEKLIGKNKNVCIPQFQIITSIDYTPVFYKHGYDYFFNLDPVQLNFLDRKAHFQTKIRAFFGIQQEQNLGKFNGNETLQIMNESFIVNRPFIFIVTEEETQSIIFMGKVLEPYKFSRYANAFVKCKIFSEYECDSN